MEKIVVYKFTEDEVERLRENVPVSPCEYCKGSSCTGCEKGIKYGAKLNNFDGTELRAIAEHLAELRGKLQAIPGILDVVRKDVEETFREYPQLGEIVSFGEELLNIRKELGNVEVACQRMGASIHQSREQSGKTILSAFREMNERESKYIGEAYK